MKIDFTQPIRKLIRLTKAERQFSAQMIKSCRKWNRKKPDLIEARRMIYFRYA